MTTTENAAREPKKEEFCIKGCEDMMKMMTRCMEGKGEKIDFEKFCVRMSGMCRGMMKTMHEKNKDDGAQP